MRAILRSAILSTIVVLASCSKDYDNTTTPDEELAEYTIITYGCAGGNLDDCMYFNFLEVEGMGYQEDVQFTAMFKFSTSWQEVNEECEGTRLMTMEPSGELSNTRIGDADLRLDDPQNLADFIIEAKRRLPAKRYILVLLNHGSGFGIEDQLVEASYATKGVCFDDNTDDASISIFELEAALELVGEKIDMLYWNACLMNTIENSYQIREYFDYIIGSNHSSYLGNYSLLINSFLTHDDITEAGRYYVEKLVESWRDYGMPTASDVALIQCDKIERVVELIGEACDILCDYRDTLEQGSFDDYSYKYINGDSSEQAKEYYFSQDYKEQNPSSYYTEGGIHYVYEFKFSMIDLNRSLRAMSFEITSGYLSAVSTLLNDATNDMYLSREYLNADLMGDLNDTGVPVCWLSDVSYNYEYSADKYAITSLAELYPHLDFDKATGWGSRFLAGNVMQAIGLDPESNSFYVIER